MTILICHNLSNQDKFPEIPDRCRYPDCGSESLTITPGTGPHAAQVCCRVCHRHQKWLGKATVEAIGPEVIAIDQPSSPSQLSLFGEVL